MIIGLVLLFQAIGVGAFYADDSDEILSSCSMDEYDMVIIAPEIFSVEIQTLIDHKNSVGIQTFLKTTEEIYLEYNGRDKPEQIKYFIKDAIESKKINYVLLIGGEDKLPVRYSYSNNGSIYHDAELFISDLYYADVYDENGSFCSWDFNNNNRFGETKYIEFPGDIWGKESISIDLDKLDLYPDVHIGRLLCNNNSDVNIVVNKIKEYEEKKAGESWFNNILLIGGNTFPNFYIIFEKFLMKKLSLEYNETRAWEGEYMCTKIEELMSNFNAIKLFGSLLWNPKKLLMDEYLFPSVDNVNNVINNGVGFLFYSGHGSPTGFANYFPFIRNDNFVLPYPNGYWIPEISNLINKEKLPITMLHGCSMGDFSNISGVSSPIAWELVKHENGGAIACFANSNPSHPGVGTGVSETCDGCLFLGLFKAYNRGIDTVGELLTFTINDYLKNVFSVLKEKEPAMLFNHYYHLEMFTLFGDPSLKIGGY
ncbi:MAG: hypothetical protein K8R68_04030 [Bacteroidales bacterium]|nr:hypothetical protein [Bacteroidales bacterium]